MKKFLCVAALAALFASGTFAETKKAVYTVNPQMSCQNCENKIKSNLRFEKGVKNVETSLNDQTITVTYDDTKTDSEKIIAGFKKVGYTAAIADGNTAAAPQQCTKDAEGKCDKKCEKSEDKACDKNCEKSEDKACDKKCEKSEEKACDKKCDKSKDKECKKDCEKSKDKECKKDCEKSKK